MTDTFEHDTDPATHPVFAGLVPRRDDTVRRTDAGNRAVTRSRHLAPKAPATRESNRLVRGLQSTVPILLVGSMAVSMNLTGPIEPAAAKRSTGMKQGMSEFGAALRDAMTAAKSLTAQAAAAIPGAQLATAAAPTTYRVVAGDTVSDIAGRYGLSTASVLALNGLSWSSLIFPGQTLKLTKGTTAPATPAGPNTPTTVENKYTIVAGDTISRIASRFGVSTESVLSANGLGWKSIIYPGQKITIPGGSGSSSAPAPKASTNGSYRIVAGDTLTRIANKFGVSIQSLLDANGLSISSTIYAGRTLVIPGIVTASSTSGITPLTAEMRANAKVIVQVGRDLGVGDYGIVIALATAMQESTLRNLDWGDRDSIGLFQQRPSAGWGTVAEIMDPVHSSRLFYGGPTNPNKGNTRGLLDIAGWKSLTVTQAAQAVQISAYPNAYAKWEASARAWLAELG